MFDASIEVCWKMNAWEGEKKIIIMPVPSCYFHGVYSY